MAAKQTKKKKKPIGRHRIPRRWAEGVARRKAKAAKARTKIEIRYLKGRDGMIRWQPADAPKGRKVSRPYASRQGARRAAMKRFRGYTVVCIPRPVAA